MDAFTIIAIFFVAIAAVVLIAIIRSRSSEESYPPVSAPKPYTDLPMSPSFPASKTPIPDDTVVKSPDSEELAGKWIYTKAKEKFIPQETVYEYRRMTPCMLCPFCDAENDVGATECQVCGMLFRRGV